MLAEERDGLHIFIEPPEQGKRVSFIEWQTWPFNDAQPNFQWSRGICELEDFIYDIKPALIIAGQTPFWREICIEIQ